MENDLKNFVLKLCDSIHAIHKSSFKATSQDEKFQVKFLAFSHVHNEIDFYWKNIQLREFCLEILEEDEGCFGLLLERWSFSLTSCQEVRDFARGIRALSAAAGLMPSVVKINKGIYIRDKSLCTAWPSELAETKIKQFPIEPYRVSQNGKTLQIKVQYYNKDIKPKMCIQEFKERPRLLSAGYEVPLSSPRTRSFHFEANAINMIQSQIYTEEKVGINLISSEVYDGSSNDQDSFGRNSFDMEFDIEADTPEEEAKISLYMLNCNKIKDLNLFQDTNVLLKDLTDQHKSSDYFNRS